MSVHVSSWVWRNTKTLRAGVRLVLVRIADMANDDGEAWPSFTTLADEVNKTRRQIMSDVKELERLGLITKTAQVDTKGRTKSNLYRIMMTAQPEVARVKPTSPPQGEAHFTPPVKPTSPPQGSPLHPPKGEPSVEPSVEPTPPPSPRAGGSDALEVERRLWADHGTRVDRKLRRAIKYRIRAGESVDDLVADYALPPAWSPPPENPTAAILWRRILATVREVEKIPDPSFATWLAPLVAVAERPRPRWGLAELVLAAPSMEFSKACERSYGLAIAKSGTLLSTRILWWHPGGVRSPEAAA